MGVKGLWRLVASAGKPVSLESLNGKILAVDVSIWLNKAAKGMRDKRGNAIYNAHLVLMFHRICKLLFYGIKPVFVFDGGVPELKKKTLRLRRERRSQADSNRKRTKDQILKNYLQTKALEAVTGVKSTTKLQLRDKKEKEDIFKLPEQPVQNDSSDSSSDDDVLNEDEWLRTLNESRVQLMFDKAEKLDTSSAEFNALPAEVKHELLTEIKDYQRRRYRRKNEAEVKLPQEAGTFSDFQLGNLMKRGQITHQIDELRKEMNSSMAAQFIELYHDVDQKKYKDKHIEGKRYVSNEKQGYVLIKKNVKDKSQNVLFQSSLDDDYARFKKREDDAAENPADVFRKLEREPARFQTIVEKNASRKRLKSDSSDEGSVVEVKIKVPRLTGPEAVTLSKDVTQDTAKDEVELMSASSSEESETDDTVNVTERKMEGICTAEKVPSKSALSKEVVEPTPNNQKEIVLLSNNDSSRESKTEASETFVGGKIDVSLAAKQEVKELTEISNDAVVTEPSSMVSAPSKMNSTVSRPPPNSIKIKSTSNTVDDSSAKISSANDGKIENVRNDKNIAVVTETNDFTKMSSSVTDNDNPSDAPPMIKPTLDLITDLITDKDTSTSLISPAISSSRTPSSNLSNPPETPMDSNEKDFPGEENIKQAEQQPAPSQPVSSQPAPSQPAPSQPAPQIPMEDLIGLQKDLEKEHDRLEDTTKKLKRQAATLSDETYQDVQELLRLFGIPYLVSPAEAEAQCAQLDFSKLTDGSITDDSDISRFVSYKKNTFRNQNFMLLKYSFIFKTSRAKNISS
uniref:XPG N-terminal domain-containing protein n=1 Tax=Clytia hemisphaerica TaxID=252671 RepID=A0A7M5UZP7_9CNID